MHDSPLQGVETGSDALRFTRTIVVRAKLIEGEKIPAFLRY